MEMLAEGIALDAFKINRFKTKEVLLGDLSLETLERDYLTRQLCFLKDFCTCGFQLVRFSYKNDCI